MRKRGWAIVAASLVTMLALIVAPTCAPLCAAQACSQFPGAGTKASCHSAEASPGSAIHFRSVQNCGALELQAADLTSASLHSSMQPRGFLVSSGSLELPTAALLAQMENHGGGGGAHTPPPKYCNFSAAVALRI